MNGFRGPRDSSYKFMLKRRQNSEGDNAEVENSEVENAEVTIQ